MLRIITLLNQKNHYLEKFYALNETEILNFAQDDYSNLDQFYHTREQILKTIRYVDSEIDGASKLLTDVSIELRKEISVNMEIKDQYVTRILAQDLEILSCIETAKSAIIRELQEIKRTKKAVGGYKSPTFVKRLDEEI